jgi:dCMP deaminase
LYDPCFLFAQLVKYIIMLNKALILHVPVIHRGYLDFLEKIQPTISETYIIAEELLEELSEFKPDIAAIDAVTIKNLLEKMGFAQVSILSKGQIAKLYGKQLILVNDEISRSLQAQYLANEVVEWQSVFLRWDKTKILAQQNFENVPISKDAFAIQMLQEAIGESEKSGDWWRQVGAVLVKDRAVIVKTTNRNLPSDYTPYQVGAARDFFKAGEHPELANTIHAEEYIIAQAARRGVSVDGTVLYVTTFPCPVCAKLIACSGITEVYFCEGWANFDAQKILESAGVKITQVLVKRPVT